MGNADINANVLVGTIMDRPADFTRQTVSDWIAVRKGSIEGFPHMLVGYMRVSSSVERTLFTLDWIESPEQRRRATRELNKGEAENAMKRHLFPSRRPRPRSWPPVARLSFD